MADVQQDKNTLTASVSGGLNTVSTALSLPPDDTPEMLNMDNLFNGNVRKRRGLRAKYFDAVDPRKTSFTSIKTKTGRTLIIGKYNTDIKITDVATATVMTKANVWTSSANKADIVVAAEKDRTRVIFLTGNNIPVQLSLIELTTTWTSVGGNFVNIPISTRDWTYQTPSTLFLFVDGVLTTATGFIYSASNLITVQTAAVPDGSHTITLIGLTWQWWAESMRIRSNILFGSAVQGTGSVHVPVPAPMQTAVASLGSGLNRYPINAHNGTDYDSFFTNILTPPATNLQYIWSSGVDLANTAGVAKRPVPSPGFITFGAVPAANRQVNFTRGIRLPFKGGDGAQHRVGIETLAVWNQFDGLGWVVERVRPPSEGGAGTGILGNGYHLRQDYTYLVENTTATNAIYWSPDATATVAGGISTIPLDDAVFITDIDTNPIIGKYIGSNALGSAVTTTADRADTLRDRYPYAVHGISQFCDYKEGSFPSTGTIWQGRMVLGGMTKAPSRIAISALFDATTPGYAYVDFQIEYGEGAETDGFELNVATFGDDRIRAVREFQNQLFIWSRYRMYRLDPGSTGTNPLVSTVAQVGCVNAQCACVTERTVLFLSQNGLFGVEPTQNADGYTVTEASVKIRNRLGVDRPYLEDAAWIAYDATRSDVYVGVNNALSSDLANELYVLNLLRNAWTQYSDGSGYKMKTAGGFVVYETTTNSKVYLVGWQNNSINSLMLRYFDEDLTFDADCNELVWAYTSADWINVHPEYYHSFFTINNLLEYAPEFFKPSCIIDYEDIKVTLNNTPLAFGTDYFKTERRTIVLTSNPLDGNDLVVTPQMRWSDALYDPVAVMVNGEIIEPTEYSTRRNGGFWQIRFNAASGYIPAPGDLVTAGSVYPCWHYSPTFSRGTITNAKRLVSYAGYYNNEASGESWTVGDIPTDRYDLIGTHKKKLNVDVVCLFSDESSGDVQSELYGDSSMSWDETLLDVGIPAMAYQPYARLMVGIVGTGYTFQVVNILVSPATFQLAGYQLTAIVKKGRNVKE